jgi:hypothetical protein
MSCHHAHGFRVVIEPGVQLPAGIESGAALEIDADFSVYDMGDGSPAYEGKRNALNSYEGALPKWKASVRRLS